MMDHDENEQIYLRGCEDEPGCDECHWYSALKEPRTLSDGATIYGYCFVHGDTETSHGMGKGFPVFIPEGKCKKFKRRKKEKWGIA